MIKERPPINLFFLLIPAVLSSILTSSTYLTVIPSFILIIYSYYNNFKFQKNSFNSTLSCLMIVGVSLLIHSFIITDLPTGNGPHIMAASMIVLMVYLWYYENPKITTGLIVLLSMLVMIFTGNNLNNESMIYPAMVYFYIPMFMMYLFSINKRIDYKKILLLLAGILTINITSFYLNKLLFLADDKLNLLLQDLIQNTNYDYRQGFSNQLEIQNQVDLKLSKKPLMIYKGKKTQYLRGEVLVNYSRKSWTGIQKTLGNPESLQINEKQLMTYDKSTLNKAKKDIEGLKTGSIDFLDPTQTPSLPINTLAFSKGDYKIKPYNTLTSNNKINSIEIYTSEKNDLSYNLQNDETDIDRQLKNTLINLSNKITEKNTDNLSKAQSIQAYLQNYKYSLNVNFDQDKEPIIDFIFNKKSGFCLHFASAMTLMLRSINIPANIVSGYIVNEYNDNFDGYVIRERDAHAWVEVFDENTNTWRTFDPTPASQMTEYMNSDIPFLDQITLYIKAYLIKFKSIFSIFSIENINKIGKSPYSLFILLVATFFIVFRNYKFKDRQIYTDNKTKVFLKNLNKTLKKYRIEFKQTMTYNELILLLENNNEIPDNIKHRLINDIKTFQDEKYRVLNTF